ncbi:hypothetical protein ACFWP7_08930 [Streptomyces sp. NPDC058470]|uniref:hypothetical protein n=1 Tax=Streptomyces sp. NPDC058470 TaxID=3346515 RepID=UPI0036528E48
MSEISRRTMLGAATGTATAAALLTAAGTARAAATVDDESEDTRQATNQETDTPMAVTTEEQKYEAYVASSDEWLTHAIFDAHSDSGDMWAFVDAALARLRQRYPTMTFTGNVRRYDQVITDIAHP